VAEQATREVYGRTLVELGRERPDLVVLEADLSPSTMTCYFAEAFPQRHFDCGIAEQNMVSIAAGLAASGKVVFASTFAVFAAPKVYDQVRMNVAQPGLNVKIVATHGGITVGEDGFSHQAVEDLALMSSLPGLTVIVPADGPEAEQTVRAAARLPGPFYIRLGRPKTPVVHGEGYRFEVGRAEVLREGRDVTIIACGALVSRALLAAEALAGEGVGCRVVNMATIKPLDEAAVEAAARDTGAMVVAEEHLEQGALGGAVARAVARRQPVPVEFVSLKDCFGTSGPADSLLERYCLTEPHITAAARRAVERKRA
jgi:transketolase